jgi:tight adherence protein B
VTAAALTAATVFLTAWLARGLVRVPARVVARPRGAADAAVRSAGVLIRLGHRFVPLLGRWADRRSARATAAAWPAVADEIGAGLRAGASLRQALEAATGRGGAAGARVASVLRPVDRGGALAEAAGRWATSAADAGEVLVAHAVELAAATGHSTPLLFDTVADGLRERAALAGEVRAQTAQARASALALGLLPLGFTGLLALTDPSVPRFLVGSRLGWACLAVGLALEAAGGWWMHRIITGVLP